MKIIRRILLCLGLSILLGISTFATDCESITAQWFGSDGRDGSILELETVETDKEVAAVLGSYAREREEQFTSEIVAASRQTDRTQQIAQMEQRINAEITDAEVTTLVTDVEETEDGIVATVYEWTFFDYDDLADGVGGSDTAGFGTEHKMTFQYSEEGQLILVSDEYIESDVLTGEIPADNTETEAPILGIPLVTNPNYVKNYDPIKAILYADQWVTHEDLDGGEDPSYYNPAYKSYHDLGGDCSNYVSQCLYAGGMQQSGQWVPGNYVWTNCQGQHFHFWQQGKTVPNPKPEDFYPGSPLYYKGYSHVTLCVGYNSAGTPVINGHTSDRYRIPWNYSDVEIIYSLQLTEYRLDPVDFNEDTLYPQQDRIVSLYGFFRDETAKKEVPVKKGEELPVCAVFHYGDAQWAAITYQGQLWYIKLDEFLLLGSRAMDITVSKTEVTTNDYLTITASLLKDTLVSASMTIGESKELNMDVVDGKATLTLDCQKFSPGNKQIKVVAQGESGETWIGLRQIHVTEENQVSGDGWSLDKKTGKLMILSDVQEAGWLRFADRIKTVEVSAAVTRLPENAFEGSAITTVYGSQDFLEALAAQMGVTFVYNIFQDVSPTDWYYKDANAAAKIGAFQGTSATEFSGTMTMTRSMFVTVLARISGEDLEKFEKTPFTDVEENTWYSAGLRWGYSTGIVKGTSDTTFSPNMEVTREQALTMIARFIGYYKVVLEDAQTPAAAFVDGKDISAWAAKDVETMRLKGIAQGTPEGEFQPLRSMTRAEAATFVMRLVRSIGDQQLIPPMGDNDAETGEAPEIGEQPEPEEVFA